MEIDHEIFYMAILLLPLIQEGLVSVTVKPVLSGHSKKRPKIGFQDRLSFNAGQKYCRMLQESILQYFLPAFSKHLSFRPLFCLFLSGHSRQVLLYKRKYVHEILVNRLVKLAQEKIVVRLTDGLDMTMTVDWEVKPQIKQNICFTSIFFCFVCFDALRPKSTAMVTAGRSVDLT